MTVKSTCLALGVVTFLNSQASVAQVWECDEGNNTTSISTNIDPKAAHWECPGPNGQPLLSTRKSSQACVYVAPASGECVLVSPSSDAYLGVRRGTSQGQVRRILGLPLAQKPYSGATDSAGAVWVYRRSPSPYLEVIFEGGIVKTARLSGYGSGSVKTASH